MSNALWTFLDNSAVFGYFTQFSLTYSKCSNVELFTKQISDDSSLYLSTSTILLSHQVVSREPFCVWYILRPSLPLVHPGSMNPCLPTPGKSPHTQDASLLSMGLDRWTHREYKVHPAVTCFFCCSFSFL